MSFVSILKKAVSTLLGAEHIVAPIAEAILPQYAAEIAESDKILGTIETSIKTIEINNPVDGQGQLKLAAVMADFQASLSMANEGLALTGDTIDYDKTELQSGISSLTAGYNSIAKVKASFKVVKIATTAAPVAP